MRYIAYTLFEPEAQQREIWMAWLSDFPFESFEEQPDALKGYMPADLYETHKQAIDAFMQDHHLQFRVEELPDQDWNEVWESQFEPIEVEGCSIRAPFHPRNEACRYDLVVMPKMAFGTGHHATTCLMISQIMACDLSGAWG
ncbi:MAG: 50S ribosomal protein L11 methyltransferase, partial [Alistipes sp.]|nr:50S ribosomal protein L11 methyltransferase [Alistipes sp.]